MMPLDIDFELLRRIDVLRTAVSGFAGGEGDADEARIAYEAVQERTEGALEQIRSEVTSYGSTLEEALKQKSADSDDLRERLVSPLALIENLVMGLDSSPPVTPAVEPGATNESEGLDDVAAFLVQMEPTLMDSITELRDRFQRTVEAWKGPDEAHTRLREALAQLNEVASKKRSRKALRVEAVEKVGQALEVAMDAEEDEESLSADRIEAGGKAPPDGSPDPGATPAEDAAPAQVEPAAASTAGARPSSLDSDPELVLDFVAEGLEYLDQAEEALLSLELNPSDQEAVNVTFRAFHTIKGVAGFLEFDQVSNIAHEAETLLSQVRDGSLHFTGAAADLFLRSSDILRGLLESIRAVVGGGAEIIPGGIDRLVQLLADPDLAGKVARNEQLGIRRRDVEEEPEATDQNDPASGGANETVRIPTSRLDRLIDLVGELVVSHSMVEEDPEVQRDHGELYKKVGHSEKLIRELQDLSTTLRMVPLKPAFHKVSRVIRDVAKKSGKKVRMVATGDDTELDRSMVAIITDPLVHMVRNSIDHGIESPAERRAAGKPEFGTLRLSARHSGGSVVVEIEDDGKGLDRDQILAKAVEKGLMEPGRNPSDEEIFNLILEPGFSTAAQVTDISGRGVGMDVVRRAVDTLRGRIEIQSKRGEGTRISLYLPLTLAITDGMLVRVAEERYIIPTVKIQVTLQPTREQLSTVSGRGELVMLHGQLIPIARMHRIFNIEDCETDLTKALLVIVGEGDRQTALMVDEILGQNQFVVKPLTGRVAGTSGIAGGAILGDGGVGLILDPDGLIDGFAKRGRKASKIEAA